MFTGYGALTIAECSRRTASARSLEIDPFLAEFSRPFFDGKIAARPQGRRRASAPTLETMREYDAAAEGGGFDMIFIDADKGGYAAYYEAALSTPGLLAEGGVIVVDNTLFKGQAYLPRAATAERDYNWNDGGEAIAAFNEMVRDDERVEQVILPDPRRDGITIVRRAGGVEPRMIAAAAETPVADRRRTPPRRRIRARRRERPPRATSGAGAEAAPAARRRRRRRRDGVGGKAILDRMRLDGKVALVTGGGQGIDRAFAHALCEAGAAVMVVDLASTSAVVARARQGRRSCPAHALATARAAPASRAGKLRRTSGARTSRRSRRSGWSTTRARASRLLGGLHIAVNNAGINKNSAAEDTPMAEFDATFGVNTRGVFMCCQHEARHMLKNGGGKIINTASMASLIVPHPQKQAAYNASKSAVVKLTQSLACEWADRGVNVNCISPGIVDTPLIWDNPALKPLAEKWVADMPIGRLCEVTDLQAAIVYLASEASDYMVGHNLVIEGGQSLSSRRGAASAPTTSSCPPPTCSTSSTAPARSAPRTSPSPSRSSSSRHRLGVLAGCRAARQSICAELPEQCAELRRKLRRIAR